MIGVEIVGYMTGLAVTDRKRKDERYGPTIHNFVSDRFS